MSLSKWLVVAGAVLMAIGAAVWIFGKAGIPLGKLPGDLHYKGEKMQIYFPIATSLLLSLLLSFLFWLFQKRG